MKITNSLLSFLALTLTSSYSFAHQTDYPKAKYKLVSTACSDSSEVTDKTPLSHIVDLSDRLETTHITQTNEKEFLFEFDFKDPSNPDVIKSRAQS